MFATRKFLAVAAGLLIAAPGLALADTYTKADFSGAINPGGANVKPPFSGNGFSQSDPLSGHFVFDNQMIGGAGFTNVFFNSYPDAAGIPSADQFSLTLDGLTFTAADNIDALLPAGVQYHDGHFNGFEFITDFLFQSAYYQFRVDGSVITVKLLDGVANPFDVHGNPTGRSLINAHINIGDGNLTNETPYTPVVGGGGGGVPEPATWALMLLGFGGVGFALRRKARAILA